MVKRIVILILLTLFPLEGNAFSTDNYLPVEIYYNVEDPYVGYSYLEAPYIIRDKHDVSEPVRLMGKRECLKYIYNYNKLEENITRSSKNKYVFFHQRVMKFNPVLTFCIKETLIRKDIFSGDSEIRSFPSQLIDEQLKNMDNPRLYKAVIDSYE